ncbi:hypothetical protein [Chitinophaga sp. 22620]|uniref:hypothetical protein n=1 Tax=Chitinophaga sp. 22620 TaxID=3453952 RepID=UPI003F826523
MKIAPAAKPVGPVAVLPSRPPDSRSPIVDIMPKHLPALRFSRKPGIVRSVQNRTLSWFRFTVHPLITIRFTAFQTVYTFESSNKQKQKNT